MRDVEPKRREQRILFVLGAEHALRDVAAAARLRARIPGGPPVHRDVDQEGDHRHPGGVQIGDKVEDGALRRTARMVDGGEFDLHASMPPTARTAKTASTVTMPILMTN